MLMLVTANNFLQMFFGWEGVGLASYLLIGFWYSQPEANAAAIKAFVVNRVGDFGFALGIFGIFYVFGTLDFDAVFAAAPAMAGKTFLFAGHNVDILTTLCLLLFVGAMGKSAQFLLHTWLPDAMEGPTPVSALIHAATMVTAGVFLVCRCSPLFELAPIALDFVTFIGATHCLLRRLHRPVPERHQAGDRLFDLFAARLHVRRRRRFGLWRGDVPSLHPCLLQGAPVPRRRLRDPCDASRAGHAEDGRAGAAHSVHLGDDADRQSGAHRRRHSAAGHRHRRLLFQGRHHQRHLRRATGIGTYAFVLTLVAAGMTFYSWRQFLMTFHGRYRGRGARPRSHSMTIITTTTPRSWKRSTNRL